MSNLALLAAANLVTLLSTPMQDLHLSKDRITQAAEKCVGWPDDIIAASPDLKRRFYFEGRTSFFFKTSIELTVAPDGTCTKGALNPYMAIYAPADELPPHAISYHGALQAGTKVYAVFLTFQDYMGNRTYSVMSGELGGTAQLQEAGLSTEYTDTSPDK